MFDFRLLVSAIVLVCLDAIYLNLFKNYFNKQVLQIQGSGINLNYLAAIICYIFIIIGLNYFIIKPRRSVNDAFLFGIVIYGVYETTNWAIFKNWSVVSVVIDTLWGGTLFALTTFIVNGFRIR
jgi:uncharacterized membrane protein